jgi:hypothetical protein
VEEAVIALAEALAGQQDAQAGQHGRELATAAGTRNRADEPGGKVHI